MPPYNESDNCDLLAIVGSEQLLNANPESWFIELCLFLIVVFFSFHCRLFVFFWGVFVCSLVLVCFRNYVPLRLFHVEERTSCTCNSSAAWYLVFRKEKHVNVTHTYCAPLTWFVWQWTMPKLEHRVHCYSMNLKRVMNLKVTLL